MKTFNAKFTSEKLQLGNWLWGASESELIEKYHDLMMDLYDKTPFWYRISKRGGRVTIFNKIGIIVKLNLLIEDVNNLNDIKRVDTYRQFVFAGENERKMIDNIKSELARRNKLPVFKNGNFPVKTNKLLTNLINK